MPSVELIVVENQNVPGTYLMRTDRGVAQYGPLELANTYLTRGKAGAAITRIKGSYDLKLKVARLEIIS